MKKQSAQFGLGTLERFATSFRADFRFGPINMLVLLAMCLVGLVLHLIIYPFDLQVVITMLATALVLAVTLRCSQIWESALIMATMAGLAVYLRHRPDSWILVTAVVVAGLVSPCLQMAYQWEKAVMLRFGSFRGLRGLRPLLHVAGHRQGLQLRRPKDPGHRLQGGDHTDERYGSRQCRCHRILDGVGCGEIGTRGRRLH